MGIGRGDMFPFADFPRGHCRTPQSFGKDANHYPGSHHSCYGRPNARSHPAATASFRLQSRQPNVPTTKRGASVKRSEKKSPNQDYYSLANNPNQDHHLLSSHPRERERERKKRREKREERREKREERREKREER